MEFGIDRFWYRLRPIAARLGVAVFCALPALAGCAVDHPTDPSREALTQESLQFDADADGFGGRYDCDDLDPALPEQCPLAAPEPGRPVWCDDGLPLPESKSLMNWVNHFEMVDGREKGLREYLYDVDGRDRVPERCDLAFMATRGGPQDANTEQLVRALVQEGTETSVGYVLGGRSLWPFNADDWDYPNHAMKPACPSADGRTRLQDVQRGCTSAISLRRTSPWDPCGNLYDGKVILIGGGQRAHQYPKTNLLDGLRRAVANGELAEVEHVVDIDDLHWSHACRAAFGARGCCHAANGTRRHSGHAGVQLVISTDVLGYGPVCKNEGDPLHRYECSDLSARPALERLTEVLGRILHQPRHIRARLEDGAGVAELIELGPLSDPALHEVIESDLSPREIEAVLVANAPLSDRVLQAFMDRVDAVPVLERVLLANTPLSSASLFTMLSSVEATATLEQVLVANSPGLHTDVLVEMMHHVDSVSTIENVLLANSPGLSDTALLEALAEIESSRSSSQVLQANCPLSPQVLDAAREVLRSRDFRDAASCED